MRVAIRGEGGGRRRAAARKRAPVDSADATRGGGGGGATKGAPTSKRASSSLMYSLRTPRDLPMDARNTIASSSMRKGVSSSENANDTTIHNDAILLTEPRASELVSTVIVASNGQRGGEGSKVPGQVQGGTLAASTSGSANHRARPGG